MPALLYLMYFPIVSFFVTSSLLILFFAIFLYILSFPLIPLSAAGPTEVKRKSPLTTAWAWALLQVFSTGYTTNICVSSTSSSCWSLTWLAIFAKAFLTAMCKGWDYNNSYSVLQLHIHGAVWGTLSRNITGDSRDLFYLHPWIILDCSMYNRKLHLTLGIYTNS